jgi:ATP-dependent DNA helicase RecG
VNEALCHLSREGIVTAFVHRDYEIEGAKCQLSATADTITVKSPGLPPPPVALEQLQSFTAPMLIRNPILHHVFSQMDLAEERGLGLRSMKHRAEQAGLPAYSWDASYLVLTLYRSAESASRTLKPEVLQSLNTVSSGELMKDLGFDERKAQRVLKKLMAVKLIRRVGKGPATRYEVLRY